MERTTSGGAQGQYVLGGAGVNRGAPSAELRCEMDSASTHPGDSDRLPRGPAVPNCIPDT